MVKNTARKVKYYMDFKPNPNPHFKNRIRIRQKHPDPQPCLRVETTSPYNLKGRRPEVSLTKVTLQICFIHKSFCFSVLGCLSIISILKIKRLTKGNKHVKNIINTSVLFNGHKKFSCAWYYALCVIKIEQIRKFKLSL